MPVVFAAAVSHAPGITAWSEAAPPAQKDRIYQAFAAQQVALDAARPDALVLLTSEHWANFFLDHMSAFCIGCAERFEGPIEPWLKVAKSTVPGAPDLARMLLERCYAAGVEPSFAHEMALDHGSMVPLSFLAPRMGVPVVPVMFNTLAPPQPTPARCLEFGRVMGRALEADSRRIAVVATGGLSHDPGERNHGTIHADFDERFLAAMARRDMAALGRYTHADLAAAGGGAFELLNWLGLAGVLDGCGKGAAGKVLAYEPVTPWATGIGILGFDVAA